MAELGVGSAMIYSMYRPIAEDDNTTICALMKLYRTYYRLIGLIIAVVGCILTPFIPKLISGDIPQGINILYSLSFKSGEQQCCPIGFLHTRIVSFRHINEQI
ncbi:MAG: hypothetical protein ACLS54_08475 [Anaerostipes hadrus]